MITKNKKNNTVTISQEEYSALKQTVQVNSEYLQGKFESLNSAEDLIKDLENL